MQTAHLQLSAPSPVWLTCRRLGRHLRAARWPGCQRWRPAPERQLPAGSTGVVITVRVLIREGGRPAGQCADLGPDHGKLPS